MYQEIKKKKTVYSEAIFENGSRADVFIPEDFRVKEVLHTETKKEALSKIKKYPAELDIMLFKTEDLLRRRFYNKYMAWANTHSDRTKTILIQEVDNVLSIFDNIFKE